MGGWLSATGNFRGGGCPRRPTKHLVRKRSAPSLEVSPEDSRERAGGRRRLPRLRSHRRGGRRARRRRCNGRDDAGGGDGRARRRAGATSPRGASGGGMSNQTRARGRAMWGAGGRRRESQRARALTTGIATHRHPTCAGACVRHGVRRREVRRRRRWRSLPRRREVRRARPARYGGGTSRGTRGVPKRAEASPVTASAGRR